MTSMPTIVGPIFPPPHPPIVAGLLKFPKLSSFMAFRPQIRPFWELSSWPWAPPQTQIPFFSAFFWAPLALLPLILHGRLILSCRAEDACEMEVVEAPASLALAFLPCPFFEGAPPRSPPLHQIISSFKQRWWIFYYLICLKNHVFLRHALAGGS
jgi:hypothetical protein